MKLIWRYHITDDCTYGCDVIVPLEYESVEALQELIMNAAVEGVKQGHNNFNLLDQEWLRSRDYVDEKGHWVDLPEVYTLERWFELFQVETKSELVYVA